MKRYFFSLVLLLNAPNLIAQDFFNADMLKKLIPSYGRVQFAGSVGAGSVGTGWIYGRKDNWFSDFAVGFVPRSAYDKVITVLTVKQGYSPWDIPIASSKISVSPLNCGLFISYTIDENFWFSEPEKYDPPYYGFSTGVKLNPYIGQAITYNFNPSSSHKQSLSIYYEFSTCDFKIISALSNSYLKIKDYLSLAIGIRYRFR